MDTCSNTLPTLSPRSDKILRPFFLAKEGRGNPIEAVMDLIPINSLETSSFWTWLSHMTMMIGADKSTPAWFGFHKSIGVAAVTQWQEWPYLFTKKSQKLALFLVGWLKILLQVPSITWRPSILFYPLDILVWKKQFFGGSDCSLE